VDQEKQTGRSVEELIFRKKPGSGIALHCIANRRLIPYMGWNGESLGKRLSLLVEAHLLYHCHCEARSDVAIQTAVQPGFLNAIALIMQKIFPFAIL
jgi:hypothetical protein